MHVWEIKKMFCIMSFRYYLFIDNSFLNILNREYSLSKLQTGALNVLFHRT